MSDKFISHSSTTGRGWNKKTSTTYTMVSDDGSSISRTIVDKSIHESIRSGFTVFGLILAILLIAGLISNLLRNGQSFTFGGLLQYMSDAPSISHVFLKFEVVPQIVSNAGSFNFLVPFLNACITIVNVVILLFKLLWNSLDFIFYVVGFFFS